MEDYSSSLVRGKRENDCGSIVQRVRISEGQPVQWICFLTESRRGEGF